MSSPSRPALFHSSPYNFDSRVTAREHIRLPLTLTDVTLREGQQAAEVAFSAEDEVVLARALADAGIPIIQAGYAGTDNATVARIRKAVPEIGIAVLLVGWKDDAAEAMMSARAAGADVCSVLFRAADAHLANLGYTRDTAIKRVRELVTHGRQAGFRHVVFGPSFSTLADFDFLMRLYAEGLDAGATVISLADSNGTAKPAAVAFLVETMRRLAGEQAGVRVHMHNDFGLGVANTLAGIEAGADWVEVTVNGLGERAGNCPLEELVVALEALYGIQVGVRTESLFILCKLVEQMSGVAIAPMQPVVGGDVFSNKLEIHVKAASTDPTLMEPYDPAVVGNRRTIRLGRGTGPTGVLMKLQELNLALPAELIDTAVQRVNQRAVANKKGVSDSEFRQLVGELGGAT